jgi:hypothetical protein
LPLAAAILAVIAIGALRRPADPVSSLSWAAALGTAAVLLASPHYAWYFVWPVALLCVTPWWPVWWPSLTAVLLYWDPAGGNPLWVGVTIYGGFAMLCVVDLLSRLTRSAERMGRPADTAKSQTSPSQ